MAELELRDLQKQLEDPASAVASAEETYQKNIDRVAARVLAEDIRLVMLTGPSSSGKTTTANLIADALRAQGREAEVLSLDSYFRNSDDPSYPKLPDGSRDMESPEALDLPLLRGALADILAGRPFRLPSFDFTTGKRKGEELHPAVPHGCMIIEGIHAHNPLLLDSLPKTGILKLFVSLSTNINLAGDRLISGKKMRFIRRLVRDHLYRGASAEYTLSAWENVLLGEKEHIYPYRDLADEYFDTFHTFELSVLKPYAEKLLTEKITKESVYAAVVAALLSRLPAFDLSIVPEDSLIREFIPGGIYEEIYRK